MVWIILAISLWPFFVTADDGTIFEEKLATVYSALSTEIASLKGELFIKVLPEIERLKRSQCKCAETSQDEVKITSNVTGVFIQKIEDQMKSFSKAFADEKRRGQSVEASVATIEDTLLTKQQEHTDLISENAKSVNRNEINIGEHNKEIGEIKAKVNNVIDTTHYLTDAVANISHCVEPICATGRHLKSPSFVSQWFTMKSQDENLSERVIEHGLNQIPAKVDVQIQSVSGPANGWIFTGDSVLQSDDDTIDEYGGVVYFYNKTHVVLRTPKESNNQNSAGMLVTTGGKDGRFMNNNYVHFSEGLVRVRVWSPEDFPDAIFQSKWLPLDITDPKKTFYELSHGLSEYPAFVSVQIKSRGWISEGMGAVMTSPRHWGNTGGVLYGCDEKTVRVWTAYISTAMRSEKHNSFGQLLGTKDGWGITGISTNLKGEVKVTVWSPDSFIRGKNLGEFAANVQDSELSSAVLNTIDIDNDLISFNVQALDGPNRGFLFRGYGSSQATRDPFGGAIFAYNQEGKVRVWRPNETKDGYLIHINQPCGNGTLNQASNSAAYRVSVLKTISA